MTINELQNLWAVWSSNPGSPLALGTILYLLMWLLTDTRAHGWLTRIPYLGAALSTPFAKRATTVMLAVGPGLALTLSAHMTWNDAARTALLSFAWSQFLKFQEKRPGTAAAPIVLVVLALTQSACLDKSKIEAGLNGGVDALEIAKPCLAEMRLKEEAACGNDCAATAEKWAGVRFAYDAFGCALCTLNSEAEGCATDDPCERMTEAFK